MKSLDLTPAESLVILDRQRDFVELSAKNQIKLTLMDLLAKKVFKIYIIRHDNVTASKQKIGDGTFIIGGENYSKLDLKPHEEIFRQKFAYIQKLYDNRALLPLGWFVYAFVQSIPSLIKKNYNIKKGIFENGSDIFSNLVKQTLLERNYLTIQEKKRFGFTRKKYDLTDKGIEAREKMIELKNDIEKLENLAKTSPEKAKALINSVGTNILLTKEYQIEHTSLFKIKRITSLIPDNCNAISFYDISWYDNSGSTLMDVDIDFYSNIIDFFQDLGISSESDFDFSIDLDLNFDMVDGAIDASADSGSDGGGDSGGGD